MKKIMVFIILCSTLVLGGCLDTEDFLDEVPPVDLPQASAPNPPEDEKEDKTSWEEKLIARWVAWDSFTFKSLTGGEDLVVSRDTSEADRPAISTSKYDKDFLAVAVLTTDCVACQKHVTAFDRLAAEFSSQPVNFIIIFADIFEGSENQHVAWIDSLTHVESYSNVETSCAGGACTKILGPLFNNVHPGTLYYIDKKDLMNTGRGITWKSDVDTDELYEDMKTEFIRAFHPLPITFGAGVSGLTNASTETSM